MTMLEVLMIRYQKKLNDKKRIIALKKKFKSLKLMDI